MVENEGSFLKLDHFYGRRLIGQQIVSLTSQKASAFCSLIKVVNELAYSRWPKTRITFYDYRMATKRFFVMKLKTCLLLKDCKRMKQFFKKVNRLKNVNMRTL